MTAGGGPTARSRRFVSASGACRRRALLDHFGDTRAGDPLGAVLRRVRSRHDRPAGPGLVDPSGTPQGEGAAAPANPVDAPLVEALREWRMRASDGKPAYTVAHNSTLESIAALKPSTLDELATVKGVGPAFVERHGEQVLALLARSAA